MPGGTVTFLSTDVESPTQLLRRLADDYPRVLDEHRRLLRASVAEWGGCEVEAAGDAFLVAFARASDAVAAAVDAQRRLAAHRWPAGAPVRVRMGLHTGQVTPIGDRYVGLESRARLGWATQPMVARWCSPRRRARWSRRHSRRTYA